MTPTPTHPAHKLSCKSQSKELTGEYVHCRGALPEGEECYDSLEGCPLKIVILKSWKSLMTSSTC
eukprot:3707248-Amphidinium_carterae.2